MQGVTAAGKARSGPRSKPVDQVVRGDQRRKGLVEPGEVGVLVNAAAASIVDGAPHAENAAAFMRFLLSAEAQTIFAETNYEYPLVAGVVESRADVKRGDFVESDVSLAALGAMNESTLDFIDEVGLE